MKPNQLGEMVSQSLIRIQSNALLYSLEIHRVLKVGGDELMDELCLAEQCSLGENIITSGYNLPAQGKTIKS